MGFSSSLMSNFCTGACSRFLLPICWYHWVHLFATTYVFVNSSSTGFCSLLGLSVHSYISWIEIILRRSMWTGTMSLTFKTRLMIIIVLFALRGSSGSYEIRSSFPAKAYENNSQTLGDADLVPNAALFLKSLGWTTMKWTFNSRIRLEAAVLPLELLVYRFYEYITETQYHEPINCCYCKLNPETYWYPRTR